MSVEAISIRSTPSRPEEVLSALFGRKLELGPVDMLRVGLWAATAEGLASPLGAEAVS